MSVLLLGDGVLAKPRLEVFLEFARAGVSHAGLDGSKGVTFDVEAVKGVEQTYFWVDVAEVIVADLEGLQLVEGAHGVWQCLQLVAVQI